MKVRRFFLDFDFLCLILLIFFFCCYFFKRKKNREIKFIEIFFNLSYLFFFLVYCYVFDVFQLFINDNFGYCKILF